MTPTERLTMDYSMVRGKKSTYLLLGSIHVLIGVIALIGVIVEGGRMAVLIGVSFYIALGIIILSGLFSKLQQYIIIDNNQITLKNLYNKHAQQFNWNDIQAVILSPGRFRLIMNEKQVDVNLGILRFHDIRQIKKKLQLITQAKGIRCITVKPIAHRGHSTEKL